jgi:hypothetical protein
MTCAPRVIALFVVRYIAAVPTNTKYLLTVVQQSHLILCFADDTHTESYIVSLSLCVRYMSLLLHFTDDMLKARNDEWVGTRPSVGSTVLLWM